MEHELFQSKLKPSVDVASLSGILRSSSSGQNSHRMAAMELILERSIQERRERISAKVKASLRSDPTPQPKETNEARNSPTLGVQSTTPASAPQQPQFSLLNALVGNAPRLESASANCEASQDSQKTARKSKVARRKDLSVNTETNPPPSEDVVQLACRICDVKQLRSRIRSGLYCSSCTGSLAVMRCVGCRILRISDVVTCTNCNKKFQ